MKSTSAFTALLLALLLVCFQAAQAQKTRGPATFKVVGYYPLQSALTQEANRVPLAQLTHLNLWFLNPDSLGNFPQDLSALASFAAAAHAREVEVLLSIGGGSRHPQYHHLLQAQQRRGFIDQVVSLAVQHQADGIDVDLEGEDLDENYEPFIVELAAALRAKGKLITAAVAVYYKEKLTDKALAQFDFVNVMSYDRTGPWRPDQPGPHASYAHAQQDLAYFGRVRGLAKERMTLGVPFYGYGYGPTLESEAISMNYGEIVSTFPGAQLVDEWTMPDGKLLYYNGINTIRRKTALARQQASGVMIWQLLGDAVAPDSLLDTIHQAAFGKK